MILAKRDMDNFHHAGDALIADDFIVPVGYPEMLWNIFQSNQVAIAISDRLGNILFCNKSFRHRAIESAGIDLGNYAEVSEVLIDKGSLSVRLIRVVFSDVSTDQVYLWLAFPEAEPNRVNQLSVVGSIQNFSVEGKTEAIFRTTENNKLL